MTATDRGRRSDALYYDNVGMQRRRLCDMVANLESDNAELRELLRQALWVRDDADWASIVSKAIGMGVELHA